LVCQVRYLNSAGIHAREIPGIDALAAAFPSHWLLYASFQCLPKNAMPIEIDAMVVMEDRVLLLEIKDWNGELTANGDQWLVEGRSRGRSAVDSITMKAKKVSTILSQMIPGWQTKALIDSRVVLTGTSTKANLSSAEQPYVLSLSEACSLSDHKTRTRLLGSGPILAKRPWQYEEDFDRITRNPRHFGPLETLWNGYRVVNQDYVVHPTGLWREHLAERVRDPRNKAIVRIWAFNKLPPGLNSPDRRLFVAERELRAIARLEELNSSLVSAGVLMPLPDDKDEVLTQHDELRRLPRGMTTLDRFLEKMQSELTLEDRTLASATLLNAVGELHSHGITHRDLGERNVWIGGVTSQALTGFMACQLPGEGSVAEWLEVLRYYPGSKPTLPGMQQDIEAAAHLVSQIIVGAAPKSAIAAIDALPASLSSLEPWFRRAFGLESEQRFDRGRSAAEAFGLILDAADAVVIDQALLDRYETYDIPTLRWPIQENLHSQGSKHLYRSVDPESGRPVIVKIWYGWRRGMSLASDVALMRLFDGVARVRRAGRADLPEFVGAGLSGAGAFVVYGQAAGQLWSQTEEIETPETSVVRAIALVRTVEALHGMDLDHGDIAPRNIIVGDDPAALVLIDLFDFSGVGDGRMQDGELRPHNAERLNVREIDRYAVVRLVQQHLARHGDTRLDGVLTFLGHELERDAIELLQPIVMQLQEAERAMAQVHRPTFEIYVEGEASGPLQTSGEVLFARAWDVGSGEIEYKVSGLDRELVVRASTLTTGSPGIVPTTFKSLSRASQRGLELDCDIVLSADRGAGPLPLVEFLRPRVSIVPRAALTLTPASPAIPSGPGAVPAALDVGRHWRRLIELEEEHQPRVVITREIERIGNVATYAYQRRGADFDFDPEEQVEVRRENGGRVGDLDLRAMDGHTFVVRHSTARRLLVGDIVIFAERRARTSFDRRSKAVERILADDAGIDHLIDYFTPGREIAATDYRLGVSDADLEVYSLNEGQRDAFRHVARYGPVALQQGPPGTGKTRFIAAFVHWLVTKQGASNILIASQSHEAVNNAIEALVDLYKALGGRRPNLLRIGSKGITDKIRPFHTHALRERYQVRFEAAFKHRLVGIASAMGIRRPLAQAAVDLDLEFGNLSRRIAALEAADRNEQGVSADDKRRNVRSLASAKIAFAEATQSRLGDNAADLSVDQVMTCLHERLEAEHKGVSPSDVRQMRRLIELGRDWSASLTSSHRNFEEFLAKTRNIVTATCVGVGQTKIRIDTKAFDWVIIDEAARCTAGELAVPVQVGQRVLLVGDHLQLKPMIDKPVLKALAKEMEGVPVEELERSDFERAFTSPFGLANGRTLTEQYRMTPAICDLVSRIFYQPHAVTLETSPTRETDPAFQALASPMDVPAVWIDTSLAPNRDEKPGERNRTTFRNEAEVEATMKILEHLAAEADLVAALAKGREETPIGIICMYSGQKLAIEQAFEERSWDARFRRMVRIDTVDSYQGKENTIVIMSLVRSNPKALQGHVASFNRCNVALSRAKERLFVVGDRTMWAATSPSDPMRKVLEYFTQGHAGTRILAAGELA